MVQAFARRDIDNVLVSSAHGGCGHAHGRVRGGDGASAQPLAVTCPSCAPWLLTQDGWAASEADIPETPDEVKGREDFEKRGAKDRDNVLAFALAQLAGVQLPESLRHSISGSVPAISGKLVCAQGHDAEPGSKFCGECGSALRQPAAAVRCPQGHENAGTAKFCGECGSGLSTAAQPAAAAAPQDPAVKQKPLKDWRAEDLKALARSRGIDDSGTRAQLLGRLKAAA